MLGCACSVGHRYESMDALQLMIAYESVVDPLLHVLETLLRVLDRVEIGLVALP